MEKTLLIAGKELPTGEDLASGASMHSRSVVITSTESDTISSSGATAVLWNRSSPLSARSIILTCLNQTNSFDEAVLIFDEAAFATKYENSSPSEITRVLEELVAGYQYLAYEIVSKYKGMNVGHEEKKPGKLAFVWISSQVHQNSVAKINPIVKSASAAFKAYAQSLSESLVDIEEVLPILVNVDTATDICRKDNLLISWLCDYMDALDEIKKRPAPKYYENWVKPGTKSPGGFGMFR